VLLVCELKQLLSVAFCVVRIVHKFLFKPAIEEITEIGGQWKEGDKDSCL
jgi:hypothetical protein